MSIGTPDKANTSGIITDVDVDGLDATTGRRRTLNPSAMRDLLPVAGLREYWYPAIIDHKVGQRRPTKIELLGEKIVLFRNKKGDVVASSNVCPHRGGSMGDGHCHYAGTISCPYHGWTFDENGGCVAVLGEGPESPIPGNEGAKLKMYPTATLKGCVFIWMGEREPAPLEEDIPPEFFQEFAQVQYTVTSWDCNWRQAIENVADAHGFYVHHTSLQMQRFPLPQVIQKRGPVRPRPVVVNGRAVVLPRASGVGHSQLFPGGRSQDSPYRDAYEGLDGQLYPMHEFVRLNWAKLMSKTLPYRLKSEIDPSWKAEEWIGVHLPGMNRSFHEGNYVYTRLCVPITENKTRMFYYYTTYGRTPTERTINKVWFTLASKWFKYYNFSGQDQAVMEPQVYNQPEALSATDSLPLGLRRLVVERARDFLDAKPTD